MTALQSVRWHSREQYRTAWHRMNQATLLYMLWTLGMAEGGDTYLHELARPSIRIVSDCYAASTDCAMAIDSLGTELKAVAHVDIICLTASIEGRTLMCFMNLMNLRQKDPGVTMPTVAASPTRSSANAHEPASGWPAPVSLPSGPGLGAGAVAGLGSGPGLGSPALPGPAGCSASAGPGRLRSSRRR
jgi:hypothetical protein